MIAHAEKAALGRAFVGVRDSFLFGGKYVGHFKTDSEVPQTIKIALWRLVSCAEKLLC
jgi:hypothetical protein